jgi:hypothetical protein
MTHDVLRRLVSIGTTVTLGLSGLAAGVRPVEELPTCPPGSGVSIDDFIMWDGTGGGPAPVPVRAMAACPVQRQLKYSTYDITARAGVDYVGVTNGTVTLPANVISTQIVIQILSGPKGSKTFGVRLLDGAEFIDPDAVVTLKDP